MILTEYNYFNVGDRHTKIESSPYSETFHIYMPFNEVNQLGSTEVADRELADL